ncbi:BREX system P-loop protein BrxC [Brachybacterium tyrofermentans]|uniref:BREX system P-loop protein BrxC n=1 Tax=Brachybacterium tyrofermentans TaxID=47848 RepID=UPI003FD55C62
MTTNDDLFLRPPSQNPIPNDGVSQVGMPDAQDTKQWDVLGYELRNFVCDGEYRTGLERILTSYLSGRSRSVQPAVWVSGFFGSGKSHMVRVLEHLWADTSLPDGASARGLVDLPQEIVDLLNELSTQGQRDGVSPWSVAGALDRVASGNLNTVFLGVVFRAAGLPEKIAPAQVALWMHDEGIIASVKKFVDDAGRGFLRELRMYNLSRTLSEGILNALHGYAASASDVRNQLKNQFPDVPTVSSSEAMELLERTLRLIGGGKVPPTLIVLDEVQQYIGADTDRAIDVQNLVESVSKNMGSRILLVATGQAEMTADPVLQKIQERFTTKVHLRNQDVDSVIRKVLLSKKPKQRPGLESAMERASAEISRELTGTKVGPRPEDSGILVDDYPLLPARRRFWEHVLEAASIGRAGQLRSQLHIVHDATASLGAAPVGTVIGADYLYEAQAEKLVQASRMPASVQKLIADQNAKDELRGRVLGLVQLISLLPTEKHSDTGVRATSAHLADLLVRDLANDGSLLRQRVPELLKEMVEEGILQEDHGEYRLQTEAGQLWETEYRSQLANLPNLDVTRTREDLLHKELKELAPARVLQGRSKVSRTVALHEGDAIPQVGESICLWVRSGWSGVGIQEFETEARALGPDVAVALVHVPRVQAEEFTKTLKTSIAAKRVIDGNGRPQDEEGRQAYNSMLSRQRIADEHLAVLVRNVLDEATVRLAGGTAVQATTLKQRLEKAAGDAAARLFPRMRAADDPRWATVVAKIKTGAGVEALNVVGFDGNVEDHPVVKEILGRITSAGTPAEDLRKTFEQPPYGWPLDAVKATFALLTASEHVQASVNGTAANAKQIAAQTRFGPVTLRREETVLTVSQQLMARKSLSGLGVVTDKGSPLPPAIDQVLTTLEAQVKMLSGPPPLPTITMPASVAEIRGASGNDKVVLFLSYADEIMAFAGSAKEKAALKPARTDALQQAREIISQLASLSATEDLAVSFAAFEQSGDLLAEHDQLAPTLKDLTTLARDAVRSSAEDLTAARSAARSRLAEHPSWQALDPAQQHQVLGQVGLRDEPVPDLSTSDAVLTALHGRPLSAWSDAIQAVTAKESTAVDEAVSLTSPQAVTVSLPGTTLSDLSEVGSYVEKVRALLTGALEQNNSVVVKGV